MNVDCVVGNEGILTVYLMVGTMLVEKLPNIAKKKTDISKTIAIATKLIWTNCSGDCGTLIEWNSFIDRMV